MIANLSTLESKQDAEKNILLGILNLLEMLMKMRLL